MQRLISEIWLTLAIAAAIGALAAWSVIRLWVAKVLARRDQVTMARLKAVDESWSERLWAAEDERDKAVVRVKVMDERLAAALDHTDALEVQVRRLGADPVARPADAPSPALTVRIRSVSDTGAQDHVGTAELGTLSGSSDEGPIEIDGLEVQHVHIQPVPSVNGVPQPPRGVTPNTAPADPVAPIPFAQVTRVGEEIKAPPAARATPIADLAPAVEIARAAEPASTVDSTPRSAPEPRRPRPVSSIPARRSPVAGEQRQTDDLTRIDGIGFGFAARLNALGYWRFEQIAAWDEEDMAKVSASIGTPVARIREADWPGQARRLIPTR